MFEVLGIKYNRYLQTIGGHNWYFVNIIFASSFVLLQSFILLIGYSNVSDCVSSSGVPPNRIMYPVFQESSTADIAFWMVACKSTWLDL